MNVFQYIPKRMGLMGVGFGVMLLTMGYAAPSAQAEAAPEFKGKIAKSYAESKEWWPEPVRPPKGAPNVIIFLLDDVGFAQVGSFGGLTETSSTAKESVALRAALRPLRVNPLNSPANSRPRLSSERPSSSSSSTARSK